ncbi:shewanella-like protein phosphatase 2 [Rosa rugosa]|uniref:shewanella-like protein phosphatase 2 n=1 Tax=Rosa rugosa TaxID=74645 RepID=UPI002B415CF1|nr:shewanella-like protein phosphatase 2 [Rosa rugosa]
MAELKAKKSSASSESCKDVPSLLTSFVDTLVDFTVSGHFLLPNIPLQTFYPPQDRLIAIGDVHGDLDKTKQSLRLANLIDQSDKWVGGSATVVQVGDVLDRGGDEIKILYFLEKLRREAARCGGTLITMHGNHEIMNVEGDFRYVTREGLDEFLNWAHWYRVGNRMKALCKGLENPKDPFEGLPPPLGGFQNVKKEFTEGFRARIAALRPDGPITARFLSKNVTVLVVGDSVFVHGGLLANHVSYGLERMNEEVREWVRGVKGRLAPEYCRGGNSVVWLRKFSDEFADRCDCSALQHVLETIPGAKRMIMGHTIQQFGINGACDERAIRIDVGMSKGCGDGLPEVLEINGNSGLRILTSNPLYQNKYKSPAQAGSREGVGFLEQGPRQVQVKA